MFKYPILLLMTGLLANQLGAAATPERGSTGRADYLTPDRLSTPIFPMSATPETAVFRPLTPAVSPASTLGTSGRDTCRDLTIDRKILSATPDGLAERAEFTRCYQSAIQAQQLKAAGNLVDQLCQQLAWANSAAAGDSQLSLAELGGLLQQAQAMVDSERVSPLPELVVVPDFDHTAFNVMLGELYALARTLQYAGVVAELDPLAVSQRVLTVCDGRICRLLRLNKLAEKYVTPANIAKAQQALVTKLFPVATVKADA